MDLKNYLNKYKWLLIGVPLLTLIAVFFKVRDLPKLHTSEVLISTGLVDQSKQIATEQNMDYFKLNQQFANIIEKIQLKQVMSLLSYNLILHDLENPSKAFKHYSTKLDSLSGPQKAKVIAEFKDRMRKREVLSISETGNNELYDLVASMEYDEAAINKSLTVSRKENSDFVSVSYTSQNPGLSVFVVNTLSTEFINNYTRDVDSNQYASISLLDSLLQRKQAIMNEKNEALKSFKMSHGVINLDKQSEITFTQISAAEDRKAQALREIQANQQAIQAIETSLNGQDPYSGGNSTSVNKEIVELNRQLSVANSRYVDGGFKASDKRRVDSLSNLINIRSNKLSDNNIVDPRANKQRLIEQRSTLKIALDQAKGSLRSIDNELTQLNGQYNKMVPYDAGIQNYVRDAEAATKDYMTALDQYNQTKTSQYIGPKLEIIQYGLIGKPEPSKKWIYLAMSGIASLSICFAGIVLLFFLDNTINSIEQLVNATNSPVLGSIELLHKKEKSIKNLWADVGSATLTFKNSLRSLRLEITDIMEGDNSKIIGITSMRIGEGKSFISSSLAYAFAMTGKKVLLIGGETELNNNSNVKELAMTNNFVTFLEKSKSEADDLITVLNKSDNNTSLLEIQSAKNLRAGFSTLKTDFDVILIDMNSLEEVNVAKEWLQFTEKNIMVFEAGRPFNDKQKDTFKYLKEHRGFIGMVLNKIKPE